MLVQEIMKKAVHTCEPTHTARECANVMRQHDIGFVPVCEKGGRAVGVVTDRDLTIRVLGAGLSPETPVSKVMSTDLRACRPDQDLNECEQLLSDAQKSRILVLDEKGVCVGVVSLSDIAQFEEPARAGENLCAVTEREARA